MPTNLTINPLFRILSLLKNTKNNKCSLLVLGIILLGIVALAGCFRSSPPEDINFHISTVRALMESLSFQSHNKTRLFVTSKHTCPTCIDKVTEAIASEQISHQTAICVLGESKEYAERMNFFYQRQHLLFLYAEPNLLDSIVKKDATFAANLLCGAKIGSSGSYIIFDGLQHMQQGVIAPDSIITFLLSP